MASDTQSEPADQFLTIDETAGLLGIPTSALRQGIACGLVPIRRDNEGALRIHRVEVPVDLLEQIKRSEVDPSLQVESLADEVSTLRERLDVADTQRTRLTTLLEQQANALERSASLLDASEINTARLTTLLDRSMNLLQLTDNSLPQGTGNTIESVEGGAEQLRNTTIELEQSRKDSEKFEELLQRAFAAIEKSESLSNTRTAQLGATMDKTMQMLDRAVNDAETAKSDVNRLSELMERTLNTSTRIEHEIDQRNSVIDKQHELMQRLVTVSEQAANTSTPKVIRRRTFWQRLWGGGKGI